MAKKTKRLTCRIDPGDIKSLPQQELTAILRAADPLILCGGRTLLARILKGSSDRRLKDLQLHHNPAFGTFSDLEIEDILTRIDWVITAGYLGITYEGHLPLLVFTPKGWDIEKETFAEEILHSFDDLLETGCALFHLRHLNNKHEDIINLVLEKLKTRHDPRYLPLLQAWLRVAPVPYRGPLRETIAILEAS